MQVGALGTLSYTLKKHLATKDNCLSSCSQVSWYEWSWRKSPQPTKGSKRSIKTDPCQLMMKLAEKLYVRHRAINTAVNEDLVIKSYVRRCQNLFTLRTYLLRCRAKIWHQWCFFAANASDGKLMPPNFIAAGLKIHTEQCFNNLNDVLLPSIRENYDPNKVMLVQHCASAWKKTGPDLPGGESFMFGSIAHKIWMYVIVEFTARLKDTVLSRDSASVLESWWQISQ